MSRRMTANVAVVAKEEILRILKSHPEGINAIELMSVQWLRAPIPAPTLKTYMRWLYELQAEGKAEERLVHGKGSAWFATRKTQFG